jgi:hypothetical protein
MRRVIIFAIVALLGFVPLAVRSVSAQAWDDYDAWQGVTVGEAVPLNTMAPDPAFQLLADFLGDPKENVAPNRPSLGARLTEVRTVRFENPTDTNLAFVPEVQGAEFMVVIVKSGEFVVDVKGPGSFLIDPVVGQDITAKDAERLEVMRGEITDTDSGRDVHYYPTGQYVLDERGRVCKDLCTVLPGVAVQVTDGDRIIAPAGSICIWCLLNQREHAGESQGELYVFPLLHEGDIFSWSKYAGGSAAVAEQGATPASNGYATPEQLTGATAWAFFNPSGNCRGG